MNNKMIKLIAVLLFVGASIIAMEQSDLNSQLWNAAQMNDYGQVEDLLSLGAKPASVNHVLWFAIMHGNEKMAKLLIEHGANLSEVNLVTAGKSPLMNAATKGNASMVRFLIENGADLNARSIDLVSTALMYAAGRPGNGAIVRTFLTTIPKAEREKILAQLEGIGPKVVAAELSMKQSEAVAQKDIRKMITRMMMNMDSLVDDQIVRIEQLVAAKDVDGMTARDEALRIMRNSGENQDTADLLDLNNPKTRAWLRHELEKNIRKILFSKQEPKVMSEKPHSNLEEQTVKEQDPFGEF